MERNSPKTENASTKPVHWGISQKWDAGKLGLPKPCAQPETGRVCSHSRFSGKNEATVRTWMFERCGSDIICACFFLRLGEAGPFPGKGLFGMGEDPSGTRLQAIKDHKRNRAKVTN